MRPRSILLFERLYLAETAIGAISAVFSLFTVRKLMPVLPADAPAGLERIVPLTIIGVMAVSLLIKLLLWFYAARRASNTARWIIVVFFALAVIGVLRSLAFLPGGAAVALLFPIVLTVIQAVCVWLLFRPDASAWFDGRPINDLTDTFS